MTLDEFVEHERLRLKAFERWWKTQNAKNPEHYPMCIPEDNEGIWWGSLEIFDPETDCPGILSEVKASE